MVVHSPDAFEAKKAAAAAAASRSREAAAGGATGGAADGVEDARGSDGIPPSVLAAGSNPVPPATSVTPAEEADLLGEDEHAIVHDFTAWGLSLIHI